MSVTVSYVSSALRRSPIVSILIFSAEARPGCDSPAMRPAIPRPAFLEPAAGPPRGSLRGPSPEDAFRAERPINRETRGKTAGNPKAADLLPPEKQHYICIGENTITRFRFSAFFPDPNGKSGHLPDARGKDKIPKKEAHPQLVPSPTPTTASRKTPIRMCRKRHSIRVFLLLTSSRSGSSGEDVNIQL